MVGGHIAAGFVREAGPTNLNVVLLIPGEKRPVKAELVGQGGGEHIHTVAAAREAAAVAVRAHECDVRAFDRCAVGRHRSLNYAELGAEELLTNRGHIGDGLTDDEPATQGILTHRRH